MKLVLSSLVAALVFFAWSAVAHMMLPLGSMGFSKIPNEELVLPALKSGIAAPGLYFFPWIDMQKESSKEEQAAWEARLRSGPSGLLVIQPNGDVPMSPNTLILEFVTNFLMLLLTAWVVAKIAAPFWTKVGVVTVISLISHLSISASHWIWYHFPPAFVAGELITDIVGFVLAGLVLAKMIPAGRRMSA